MKSKINIQNSIILFFVSILSAFSFQTIVAEDADWNESLESVSQSYKETIENTEELMQLKESILQKRSEIINRLINIIEEDRFRYAGTYEAMEILGQIRANEAIEILLEKADYHAPVTGLEFATRNPIESTRYYPAVKALVNIRPSYERILIEIEDVNSTVNISCYIAILVRTQGIEMSRLILEKAIDKETDEGKLIRLNHVLKMIYEDIPESGENPKSLLEGRTTITIQK